MIGALLFKKYGRAYDPLGLTEKNKNKKLSSNYIYYNGYIILV